MLADWITLNIPWWVIVLGFIGLAFWPLTIAAATTGIFAWRTRGRVARVLFAVSFVLWLTSAYVRLMPIVGNIVENIQVHQRHYVPGSGMIGNMTLVHDTTIDGVLCSSKDTLNIDFLGKLTECTLARPQLVSGVPCTGRVNLENGVQCLLGSDYKRFGYVWRASTTVRDSGDNDAWFQIGPNPPTLTVLGALLPEKAEVSYDSGKLLSITFVDHPMQRGNCIFRQVLENDGAFEAQCDDRSTVKLPATALSAEHGH